MLQVQIVLVPSLLVLESVLVTTARWCCRLKVVVDLVGGIARAARTVGRTILWTKVLVVVVLLPRRYLRHFALLVLVLGRDRDTVTLYVQRHVVVG